MNDTSISTNNFKEWITINKLYPRRNHPQSKFIKFKPSLISTRLIHKQFDNLHQNVQEIVTCSVRLCNRDAKRYNKQNMTNVDSNKAELYLDNFNFRKKISQQLPNNIESILTRRYINNKPYKSNLVSQKNIQPHPLRINNSKKKLKRTQILSQNITQRNRQCCTIKNIQSLRQRKQDSAVDGWQYHNQGSFDQLVIQ